MWYFHATGQIWCSVLYQHIEYVIQLSSISIKNNFKQIARVELKLANAVISGFQWNLYLCCYIFCILWIVLWTTVCSFLLLYCSLYCLVNYCLVASIIILFIVLSCKLLSCRVFYYSAHCIVLWTTVVSCLLSYCSLCCLSFNLRLFKLVYNDCTCIGIMCFFMM